MASLSSRLSARQQRDYSPVSWTNYFDEAHDIQINQPPGDSFRVYLRNFRQPFAPNRKLGSRINPTQNDVTQTQLNEFNQIPTLVTLHGGGYSALSWAKFTRYIEQHCHCRVLSIDLRSHGDTKTNDDQRMDIGTLVDDVNQVIHQTHKLCGFPETPKLILIGHSMGGAIAIKCSTNCPDTLPSLAGVVIIDVVEGTAKEALPLMMSVIKTRPAKFPTLNNAIEWSVRSGMAKNIDAARVSMPGNLISLTNKHLAIHDIVDDNNDNNEDKKSLLNSIMKHELEIDAESLVGPTCPIMTLPPNLPLPPRVAALKNNLPMGPPAPPPPLQANVVQSMITEENEDFQSNDNSQQSKFVCKSNPAKSKETLPDGTGYCWRTNLAKTQPFWNAWFEGLSNELLSSPVQAKFLLLAGIDRLDKTLTIGHMQGKFMMKVLPKCGHAVQEDVPEQVASVIGDFLVRNKLTLSVER